MNDLPFHIRIHSDPNLVRKPKVCSHCHTEESMIGMPRSYIDELLKQASCTHTNNAKLSLYSPFQHAWKCDRCGHVKQDG